MPQTPNAPKRLVTACAMLLMSAATLVSTAASSDAASTEPTFSIKLSSTNAGTRREPKAVALTYETSQPTPAGDPLRSVRVTFPSEIRMTPNIYELCSGPLRSCSSSLEGSGPIATGKASLPLGGSDVSFGTSVVWGRYDAAYIFARQAADTAAEQMTYRFPIKFWLTGGRWRFTYELRPRDAALESTPSLAGEFANFAFRFPRRSTTVEWGRGDETSHEKLSLVGLAGCPKGGLKFKAEFTYDPYSVTKLRTTVPCTQA